MSYLPIISGNECVKALEKIGFYVRRQSGSHIISYREEPFVQVTIPNHKSLDRVTLLNILRSAELSMSNFKELFK